MEIELEEFQRLMGEWQLAKEAASMAQLAVDLKMTEHLKEGGPPPTRKEMQHIKVRSWPIADFSFVFNLVATYG